MSATEKPVWVWLPDRAEPVLAGVLALQGRVGRFRYDPAYRRLPDATALDPMSLPFTRSVREASETRQEGLFGVFRDASPEGYGLALLERRHGRVLVDPMERLELSAGDAVGGIEICDDIEAKLAFRAPALEALRTRLADLPEERPSSQALRDLLGETGTSLGGERPKMTVQHEGALWIAKLQERGDRLHAPLREYLSMRLAARCGIDACEVRFVRVIEREVLLVRRFDRELLPFGKVRRRLFASAHTVLRLDTSIRGDRNRSYVAFAHEARRWCGSRAFDPKLLQRVIWERLAFNALIGNGDDHPRNHGLLQRNGQWVLAPAFDIAPYGRATSTLAMAVDRRGSSLVDRETIEAAGAGFGVSRDEARAWLETSANTIRETWGAELEACGYDRLVLDPPDMGWLGRRWSATGAN